MVVEESPLMKRPSFSSRIPFAPSGFSLVEVIMAIGIVSFSVLAVLGLMPVGLSTLREATDSTVESQIVQRMASESWLTSFSALQTNYNDRTFYYDDAGRYLAKSPDAEPQTTRYWVKPSVASSVYPGSSNAPTGVSLSDSIVSLRIAIHSGKTSSGAFRNTNNYAIEIPNSGK